MSNSLRLVTAASRVALGLGLGLALAMPAGAALAQQANLQQLYHTGEYDAFGAQHDYSLRAARSVPSATSLTAAQRRTLESEYRTGQESSFDAGQTSQPLMALRDYGARVASTVPTVGGKRDLIGDHGAQDALAARIYQPGSRPPGW